MTASQTGKTGSQNRSSGDPLLCRNRGVRTNQCVRVWLELELCHISEKQQFLFDRIVVLLLVVFVVDALGLQPFQAFLLQLDGIRRDGSHR